MPARAFTIGLDFGTGSVRAVVVDCADGRLVGQHVVIAAPLLVGAACLLRSRLGTQGPRYAEIARWRLT